MRTLATVSPLEDFRVVEAIFDRLINGSSRPSTSQNTNASLTLPIDITETADSLLIRAAVPGLDPEKLEIQIENQVLTIKGEFVNEIGTDEKVYRKEVPAGAFQRSVRLPDNLNAGETSAKFRHGMVTIQVPKVPEVVPPTIRVPIETL